jgi:hypothetical protein
MVNGLAIAIALCSAACQDTKTETINAGKDKAQRDERTVAVQKNTEEQRHASTQPAEVKRDTTTHASTEIETAHAKGSDAVKNTTEPEAKKEIQPFAGVVVKADEKTVELAGKVCLREGWLEQVACSPRTREHEALVAIGAKPSEIHQAMLMAGLVNGHPGTWTMEGEELKTNPPTGDALEVRVRYTDEAGKVVEHPVADWMRGQPGNHEFPKDKRWIFAGSKFVKNPKYMGEGEHYAADMSGSIVGLVTFGDELVALSEVLSDQESVQAPEWEVRTEAMPAVGTAVTLILKGVPKAGE